ncbi:MAG: L-threonylcarbamoyladenylate synthase [Fusobacteriaceae bacterium]
MGHTLFKLADLDAEQMTEFFKNDSLIIYPTDTVYGIAGRIDSKNALGKIYAVKSRAFSSPLIALISNHSLIDKIAIVDLDKKNILEKLIKSFWPGSLTIILRKKDFVPSIMVSNGETVGVRMPNHDFALKIIESAGGILPTTSANISGEKTPKTYDEISKEIKSSVDIVIDGGECPIGIESTILDLSKKEIKILREGAISRKQIEDIIGKIN